MFTVPTKLTFENIVSQSCWCLNVPTEEHIQIKCDSQCALKNLYRSNYSHVKDKCIQEIFRYNNESVPFAINISMCCSLASLYSLRCISCVSPNIVPKMTCFEEGKAGTAKKQSLLYNFIFNLKFPKRIDLNVEVSAICSRLNCIILSTNICLTES